MSDRNDTPLQSSTAQANAVSPPYYISSLLLTDAPHWGPSGTVLSGVQTGQPVTLSYAFAKSAEETGLPITGFAPLDAVQQDAARQALTAWGSVANLAFAETPSAGSAQIRFATNRQNGASAAYTYSPGAPPGGGVFLANDVVTNVSPTPGTYGYFTLVHEIGHALGLKHPGNYDALANSGDGPFLPESQDNYRYSIMSYRRSPTLPPGWPTGPSIYDIAAVQYLYGANMAAVPGNDVYALNTLTYRAIWDPNGNNALDAHTQTAPVTLDLRPGAVSNVGIYASVGLAHGTRMQRAFGGTGDDTMVPSGIGSLLDGGAGVNMTVFPGLSTQHRIVRTSTGAYVVTAPDGSQNVLINMQAVQFGDGVTLALDSIGAGAFDAMEYLASNPDVAKALGPDPAAATNHFLTTGVFENRPLIRFDPAAYLAANPDVRTAFGNDPTAATLHYVQYGVTEGRNTGGTPAVAALAETVLMEAVLPAGALQAGIEQPMLAQEATGIAGLPLAAASMDNLMIRGENAAFPMTSDSLVPRFGNASAADLVVAMAAS